MGEKAQGLARQIDEAIEIVIKTADGLSDQEWKTLCEENGRTVGQVVYHLVEAFETSAAIVHGMATGGHYSSLEYERIHERNALNAKKSSGYTKATVLDEFRKAGALAADQVQSLTDEQLEATGEVFAGAGPWTVESAIQMLFLGHAHLHLEDVRGALQGAKR